MYGKAGPYNPSFFSFTSLWLQTYSPTDKSYGSFLPCFPLRQWGVKSWVFRAHRLCFAMKLCFYKEVAPLRAEVELISCSWDYFLFHQMIVLRGLLLRNGSVFQVIPWKSFLIAVNDVSPASQVFIWFFLICEEHVNTFFHCYRHAIKFPAFESCGCQHTQRTCKPCLVENLFEATAILEVPLVPFSVLFLFSRFGNEDLIGLR